VLRSVKREVFWEFVSCYVTGGMAHGMGQFCTLCRKKKQVMDRVSDMALVFCIIQESYRQVF